MVRDHISLPRLVVKSRQCDKWFNSSSPRPQHTHLYRCHKNRLGCSVNDQAGKKATHKCTRAEGIVLGPETVWNQCQNQTVLIATDNSTVVTNMSVDVCSPMENHMLVPSLQNITRNITRNERHNAGCLNVMADLLWRGTRIQSREWSLYPQVFKRIC